MSDKIVCAICGEEVHSIQLHLRDMHADEWDLEKYQEEFKEAPILSEVAKQKFEQKKQ